MPRAKNLSTLIQNASPQTIPQVDPSHITLFCSQKQGQSLLNALSDLKPVGDLEKLPRLKGKITKIHMRMEASARDAYKLGLASNLIRGQEKCMVLNSKLFERVENENMHKRAQDILQKVKLRYNKHPRIQQKLTTVTNTFPPLSIVSPQQLTNQWILSQTSPKSQALIAHPYTLLINPTILYASDPQTHYQQCICFPFMEFMIPRYNRLLIHYYNHQYKSQFAFTEGFVSRVIQHQCQHLEGRTVVDWRVNHGAMTMNNSVVQYFPKASAVLEDYSKTLRNVFKEFPQLIAIRDQYLMDHTKIDKLLTDILKYNSLLQAKEYQKHQPQQKEQQYYIKQQQTTIKLHGRSASRSINKKLKQQQNYNSQFTINKQLVQQQLPFEDDYVVRIVKHFKKEFAKFDQKIHMGLIMSQDIIKNKQSSIKAQETNLNQYIQQEYSKTIKIKYLNSEQAGINLKLSSKQQKKIKRQIRSEGDFELSDQQALKALAKHKKGSKKK